MLYKRDNWEAQSIRETKRRGRLGPHCSTDRFLFSLSVVLYSIPSYYQCKAINQIHPPLFSSSLQNCIVSFGSPRLHQAQPQIEESRTENVNLAEYGSEYIRIHLQPFQVRSLMVLMETPLHPTVYCLNCYASDQNIFQKQQVLSLYGSRLQWWGYQNSLCLQQVSPDDFLQLRFDYHQLYEESRAWCQQFSYWVAPPGLVLYTKQQIHYLLTWSSFQAAASLSPRACYPQIPVSAST